MTLTEFVTSRLDEKAQTAHYAGPARVAWPTLRDGDGQLLYTTVAAGAGGDDDEPWCADGREVPGPFSVRVVYDPARALREVAAGRAVLAAYERHVTSFGEFMSVPERRLVEALAAVYSDHPDYDPAWAPA